MRERGIFTGNQLKFIALIAMTVDHIGAYVFPHVMVLRAVGRLAFPIFAYMAAEGCRYTRNRKRYLLTLGGLAFLFQVAAFFVTKELHQYVLVTLFLSAILCFLVDGVKKNGDVQSRFYLAACLTVVFFITALLPSALEKLKFSVDYGFFGVLFPVMIFSVEKKVYKLAAAAMMCVLLSAVSADVQWWSLAAVPLLALYNGKRGNAHMKYFYYAYFPLHFLAVGLIANVLS